MADQTKTSILGLSAYLLDGTFTGTIPEFDGFDPPGKVTDAIFRTDLPLLMLYLDSHIPTYKFKNTDYINKHRIAV